MILSFLNLTFLLLWVQGKDSLIPKAVLLIKTNFCFSELRYVNYRNYIFTSPIFKLRNRYFYLLYKITSFPLSNSANRNFSEVYTLKHFFLFGKKNGHLYSLAIPI